MAANEIERENDRKATGPVVASEVADKDLGAVSGGFLSADGAQAEADGSVPTRGRWSQLGETKQRAIWYYCATRGLDVAEFCASHGIAFDA